MSESSRWVKRKQPGRIQANNERSKWYVTVSAHQQPSPAIFEFCVIKALCDFEHIVESITFTGVLFRNHRVKLSVGKNRVEELLIKQRTDGGVRC